MLRIIAESANREAEIGEHTGLRLEPFRAVLYNAQHPGEAGAFVASSHQVEESARREPGALAEIPQHHILRLILPPSGTDHAWPGRLLRSWLAAGVLRFERHPAIYVYEQQQPSGAVLRGRIGALRVGPRRLSGVDPHEDVATHVVERSATVLTGLQADVEPLMLWYRGRGAASAVTDAAIQRPPLVEAVTDHGTVHRLWAIADQQDIAAIQDELVGCRAVIADGHHRFSAHVALHERAQTAGQPTGFWGRGLALLVDADQHPVRPGAFHRVVPGIPLAVAVDRLRPTHLVEPRTGDLPEALACLAACQHRRVALLSDGDRHFQIELPPRPAAGNDTAGLTDVELVHQHLLPRACGGSTDGVDCVASPLEAVAAAAWSGGFAVLLNPPDEADIRHAAATGRVLPKKSTNFPLKPPLGLVMRVNPYPWQQRPRGDAQ